MAGRQPMTARDHRILLASGGRIYWRFRDNGVAPVRPAFLAEEAEIRDEATVALLRASSSAAVLAACDADVRSGVPAYDEHRGDWRACACCGRRFEPVRGTQTRCSQRCRDRSRATRPTRVGPFPPGAAARRSIADYARPWRSRKGR